ncbi:hypothetical protein ACDY96_32365 [Rhizobium mongolense]|jgi:hypothetical protein|uniref:Transmembrane protein n=2 Tax=Rhizobium gallicum TaxID=56730 RepID=A0A0B4X9E8_9HYPH|nr:hypothetical protein [Rhizobium]TDW20124.1 hypothetical protein EV128_12751 [Rhizobium azibense]AJD43243.1 hypothetical protein RGR602_CH03946 [Rhizobium gallicum bv. gallicum R602sp]APO69645.1 hypothetical protein IE4872_CH04064 [Rhizobium gallicum]QPB19531.1 hypothetical protein ISN39_18500 [Rhizobium sp. 007]ULJ71631.1 hypothetical protein L2W42_17745 [Rhizobium gallicum]
MIAVMPLMVIPFILYNMTMAGLMGGGGIPALQHDIMVLSMISGAIWSMALGDLFIVVALVILFFEILKATRNGSGSLVNHMLSMLVFIAFLVEFLLVQDAATQVFFILMTIALIDVIGGFAVSIRSAGRDVSIGL